MQLPFKQNLSLDEVKKVNRPNIISRHVHTTPTPPVTGLYQPLHIYLLYIENTIYIIYIKYLLYIENTEKIGGICTGHINAMAV